MKGAWRTTAIGTSNNVSCQFFTIYQFYQNLSKCFIDVVRFDSCCSPNGYCQSFHAIHPHLPKISEPEVVSNAAAAALQRQGVALASSARGGGGGSDQRSDMVPWNGEPEPRSCEDRVSQTSNRPVSIQSYADFWQELELGAGHIQWELELDIPCIIISNNEFPFQLWDVVIRHGHRVLKGSRIHRERQRSEAAWRGALLKHLVPMPLQAGDMCLLPDSQRWKKSGNKIRWSSGCLREFWWDPLVHVYICLLENHQVSMEKHPLLQLGHTFYSYFHKSPGWVSLHAISKLVGGLEHFWFSHILGIAIIPID